MNTTRYAVHGPGVIAESVDGEVLIINLESGAYYSTAGTGEEIWALLSSGCSVGETVEHLSQRYGAGARQSVEAAVERLAAELLAEQLLAPTTGQAAVPPAAGPATTAFADPVLSKYTDMQDLLLLDPIHEVTEEGWPNIRPALPTQTP